MHGGKSEWAEGAVRTGGPISGGLLELVGAGRAESSWALCGCGRRLRTGQGGLRVVSCREQWGQNGGYGGM